MPLLPISTCAERLGILRDDLIVFIRTFPGAPYIVRGDTVFADPFILGPFLAERDVAVNERYVVMSGEYANGSDADPEDGDEDAGVEDAPRPQPNASRRRSPRR